jgi:hypothetical protein
MHEEILNQFYKSFNKKDFLVGRSPVTEYFIVTVKLGVGSYKVLVLKDFVTIFEDFQDGLTKSKNKAFEYILELKPEAFNKRNVTMVHFKHDRPSGKPWVKDTNIELNKNLEDFLQGTK